MKTVLVGLTAYIISLIGLLASDDAKWPQSYETEVYEIGIYQPQIYAWEDFKRAKARVAVAVKRKGQEDEVATFGAMVIEAETVADFDNRVVHFGTREVTKLHFPELEDEKEAAAVAKAVRSVLTPKRPLQLSLDAMLANVERSQMQSREVDVNLAPPPIYFSDKPALLMMFMGEPAFEEVSKGKPDLMFAANTNWDVLLDVDKATYYLLVDAHWLKTSDMKKGPWVAVDSVPKVFSSLPKSDNWLEARQALQAPPMAKDKMPKIVYSETPAELVITEGKPQLSPIPETKLMYVSNTEADLFFYTAEKKYYLLAAGRWFRAASITGPWSAASNDLPVEFAKIPEDHKRASVLASVAGTAEADEAVIMASIPKTATVNRDTATVEVLYDGEPQFVDIDKIQVKYAVNTYQDVFYVDQDYYCCHQGVWFTSKMPKSGWVVATKVPVAIYSIPSNHPKHNVTYVYIYQTSPTTVQVGYTSGYTGSYIAGGLLMFGLGWWAMDEWHDHYHHHHHHHYPHAYWYGYGCGAHYSWHGGGYYRAGYRYYGPHGGAGGGAIYNPHTGGYARGAYRYGRNGMAGAVVGYNPWTDTAAGRVRASTPYGSWGRSVAVRDDEWMRTGHRSNWKGTAAGFETSKGSKGVAVKRRFGSDGYAVKGKNGDIYVGGDGKIYRRDDDGDWTKREKGDWAKADTKKLNQSDRDSRGNGFKKPTNRLQDANRKELNERINKKPAVQPSIKKKVQPRSNSRGSNYRSTQSTHRQLDLDARSRSRGSSQAQRYQRTQQVSPSSRSRSRSAPSRSVPSRSRRR